MSVTTIKVPGELRDRIGAEARARGLTAAQLIAALLDEQGRTARFAAFGRAFAGADDAYRRDTEAWDATSADGMPR